jgi:rare lipoprotein A (peptidoglycan hydrolase)
VKADRPSAVDFRDRGAGLGDRVSRSAFRDHIETAAAIVDAPAPPTTETTVAPPTTAPPTTAAPRPAAAAKPVVKKATTTTTAKPKPTTTTTTKPPRTQSGQASWYDAPAGTCAHRSLPMGTIITVINTANGKRTTCRVADRGPYSAGRIIDLAKTAFDDLAPPSAGIINVRIEW